MGNQQSNCAGLLPSSELKWKTGKKVNPIPCPLLADTTNLDKLSRNIDFKEYLLQNIDSDYLITSLLTNTSKDELYASGMQMFRGLDKENSKQTKKLVETMESLAMIGIKVNREELMSLFRSDMFSSANFRMNSFFKSFQRRIALLRGLDSVISHEKSIANDLRRSREYSGTFLNSSKHPQAFLVSTVTTFSENILNTLPLIAEASPNTLPIILVSLNSLFKSFASFQSFALFHTWSPRQCPPMKPITLNIESAKASAGNPKEAIDGQKITNWSINSTKGDWFVQLEKPSDISGIKIAWAPSTTVGPVVGLAAATVIGAPKKLIIRVYFESDSNDDVNEKDFVYEPEYEMQRQGSWVQMYIMSVTKVTSIKVIVNKFCVPNQNSIRIHNFEVLQVNNESIWTDVRESLNNLELGLFPLVKYDILQDAVLGAVISLVRTSASLGIFLQFIKFLVVNDIAPSILIRQSTLLVDYMTAVHAQIAKQKCRILFGTSDTIDEVIPDAAFDPKAKSSDVVLDDGGMIAISPVSGVNSYALVNVEMNDGIWIWEMTILDDSYGDESTCLGVGRRPITNTSYETSPDLWTIRCYSGETYHINRLSARNIHVNPPIHPNDICRFTYDADKLTVSLSVNDSDRGVLFDNVPPGISPLAFFYGSKKKIQLLSLRHKVKHSLENNKTVDLSVAGPSPTIDDIKSNLSISTSLLQMVSLLAEYRISYLEYREREKKSKHAKLDYPFCIESSIPVMNLILDLVEYYHQRCNNESLSVEDRQTASQDIASLLVILSAQFYVIKQSYIDLQELGFPYKISKNYKLLSFVPSHGLDFISRAKSLLSIFMKQTDNTKLKSAAISAFAQGAILFFPNMYDKFVALSQILDDHSLIQSSQSDMQLLNMILKDMSTCSSAIQIIELVQSKPSLVSLWNEEIVSKLLSILCCAEIQKIKGDANPIVVDRAYVFGLFNYLQQQLLYEIIPEADGVNADDIKTPLENLLIHYTNTLINVCGNIMIEIGNISASGLSGTAIDNLVKDSCIGVLLNPLIHFLCFCSNNCKLIEGILPSLALMFDTLAKVTGTSPYCKKIEKIFQNSIPKNLPNAQSSIEQVGWKTVQCRLEESTSAFSIRENGALFISLHSSNTCAAGSFIFPANSKGAWEFKLEQDSLNDECSVFGAARPTFTSRCYNSSPDLWMRRSYNGSLYQNGTTLSQSMEKIHPGDVIRIEFDGKLGTLSSGVNGGPMEVMFSGIHEPVSPVCGSYRSGIHIRLLKVEIYQDSSSEDVGDAYSSEQESFEWITDPSRNDNRESTTLRMAKDYKPILSFNSVNWITSRTNIGILNGIHDVAFEILEYKSKDPLAIGLFHGKEPSYEGDHIAGKLYRPLQSQTVDEIDTSSVSFQASSNNIENTSSQQITDNGNLIDIATANSRKYLSNFSVAWKLDGSLWINGEEKAINFGGKFLPLKPLTVVTMRIDLEDKTLSYYVNGTFVGVAFGPSIFNPAVVFPIELDPTKTETFTRGTTKAGKVFDANALYPAVSISSLNQSVKIIACGFYGSLTIPFQLSLQKTLSSVYGRLCASLLGGVGRNKQENDISPWLQSPLLRGGLENIGNLNSDLTNLSWARSAGLAQHSFLTFSSFISSTSKIDGNLESMENQFDASVISQETSPQSADNHNIGNEFLLKLSTFRSDGVEWSPIEEKARKFLAWLETVQPEVAGMRELMEKRGLYSFPVCERPYIGCLLKHSNLLKEAELVVSCLQQGTLPKPSNDMISLWSRVKQLRQYLRKKRQDLTVKTDDNNNQNGSGKESPPISKENTVSLVSSEASVNVPTTGSSTSEVSSDSAVSTPETSQAVGVPGFVSENVVWKEQRPSVSSVSEDDERLNCKVISVGIDIEEELLYIRFSVTVDYSNEDSVPEASKISINEESFGAPKVDCTRANRNTSEGFEDITGYLKFDIGSEYTFAELSTAVINFTFGGNGYTPVRVQPPSDSDRVAKLSEAAPTENFELKTLSTFDEVCNVIAERAWLLLNMAPASWNDDSQNQYTSKKLLLSLMDRYTTKQGNIVSTVQDSSSPSKWGSPARDRWTRVIDFLRVHSRLRRHNSNPRSLTTSRNTYRSQSGDYAVLDDFLDRQDAQMSALRQTSGRSVEYEDGFEVESDVSTSQAAIQACALFVTGESINISPRGVMAVIKRRSIRAEQKIFALEALKAVLENNQNYLDPTSLLNMLMFVQTALTETSNSKDSENIKLGKRIHYLINLEGCSVESLTRVQEAFMGFFTSLVNVTSSYVQLWEDASSKIVDQDYLCSNNPHVYLEAISLMLSMWKMNFSNRDFRFLLHCGLLPLLFKVISLSSLEKSVEIWSRVAADIVQTIISLDGGELDTSPPKPATKSSFILDGLKAGTFSYRNVLFKIIEAKKVIETNSSFKDLILFTDDFRLSRLTSPPDYLSVYENVIALITKKLQTMKTLEEENKSAEQARKESEYTERTSILKGCGAFDDPTFSNMTVSQQNTVLTVRNERSSTVHCVTGSFEYDFDQDPSIAYGNYFEVEIIDAGPKDIGIGLADMSHFPLSNQMPGWVDASYGYHGDDGKKFGKNKTPGDWPMFTDGDVIGCGYIVSSRSIFYTKNGELLGIAFTNVSEKKMKAVVGFTDRHLAIQQIRINFGYFPFRYNGSEVILNPKALAERSNPKLSLSLGSTQINSNNLDTKTSDNLVGNKLNSLYLTFQSAASYILEYYGLRSLSFSIIRHLLLVLDENEQEDMDCANESSGRENGLSSSTHAALNRGLSNFGTLKSITLEDGKLLREEISSMIIQEILVGSKYISTIPNQIPNESSPFIKNLQNGAKILSTPFTGKFLMSEIQGEVDDFGQINSDGGILERSEVESILYRHLRVLLTLIPINSSFKDEMLSVRSIHALLTILKNGSPKLQQLTVRILTVVLPDSVPDDVEAAIVNDLDQPTSQPSSSIISTCLSVQTVPSLTRRSRRIPDSFIRLLLGKIKDTVTCSPRMYVLGSRDTSVGYGNAQLTSSEEYIRLIQALMENSTWTEIVACSLTEAFRKASEYLKSKFDVSDNSFDDSDWDFEGYQTLGLACSAAVCLSGLNVIREGSSVTLEDGTTATIVSLNYDNGSATVTSQDRRATVSSAESVKPDVVSLWHLSVINNRINMDFSRLSQPLLLNLVELLKYLLKWYDFSRQKHDQIVTASRFALNRGVVLVSSAVASIMEYQGELLTDFIQDADVLQLIISLSLLPSASEGVLTTHQYQMSWLLSQARYLESTVSETLFDELNPKLFRLRSKSSGSVPVSRDISLDVSQPSLVAAVDSSNAVLDASIESGHSFRKIEDKPILTRSLSKISKEEEINDKNILLNVDKNVNCVSPLQGQQVSVNVFYFEAINSQTLHPNTLLIESDALGLVDEITGKMFNYSKPGETDEEIIVSFFDPYIGSVVSATKPKQKLRILKTWFKQSSKWKAKASTNLDLTITLSNIRYLSSTMLLEGNLAQHSSEIDSWIRLLKLNYQAIPLERKLLPTKIDMNRLFRAVVTIGKLPSLFMNPSLPSIETTSLAMPYLIEDLKKNLKALTYSNLKREQNVQIDPDEVYGFIAESTHPFSSPVNFTNKIVIPKSWTSVSIKFDDKTDLVSPLTVLKIYRSIEAFENCDPILTVTGGGKEKINPITLFQPFSKTMFYTFESKAGGEKKPVEFDRQDSKVVVKSNSLSISKSFAPISFGDDESLFPLFNTSGTFSAEIVGYITVCDFVDDGTYFFEVLLNLSSESAEIEKYAVGIEDVNSAENGQEKENRIVGQTLLSSSIMSDGSIYCEGRKSLDYEIPKAANFCIGCLFTCDRKSITVTYAIEGRWLQPVLIPIPDEVSVYKIRPAFNLSNSIQIDCNFGQMAFKYPPVSALDEASAWLPFHCRPVPTTSLGWGYSFTVEQFSDINVAVCRKFSNIYKPEDEEKVKADDRIWIWRASPPSGFVNIGDIATFTPDCPIGALIVDKENCRPPEKYEMVLSSSSLNISIWRPIAPAGYVALGDVVVSRGSSPGKPITETCYCVPDSVLETCDIGKKIFSSRKGGTNNKYYDFSIWSTNNDLGTFFGSPSDRTELGDGKSRPEDVQVDGVGKTCRLLRYNVGSIISGEWLTESDIEIGASLSWAVKLLQYLLDDPEFRTAVLNEDMFDTILDFFRSDLSPDPLRLLQPLIRMIRYSYRSRIALPEEKIENICNKIFPHALTTIQGLEKGSQKIPERIVALMDLVTEVELGKLVVKYEEEQSSNVSTISELPDDSNLSLGEVEGENQCTEEVIESKSGLSKWWDRSFIQPVDISACTHALTDSIIEKIFSIPSSSQKSANSIQTATDNMRTALAFLYSLEQRSSTNSTFYNIYMVKLWYKFFSNCFLLESEHPCKRVKYEKKITMPGAEKLKIIFDRRCNLPTGGILTITGAGLSPAIFNSSTLTWAEKAMTISTDSLTVSFDFDDSTPTNLDEGKWGWAFMVSAVGPVFEIDSAIESLPSESSRDNKDSSEKDSVVRLHDIHLEANSIEQDNEAASLHRPPSRREQRIQISDQNAETTTENKIDLNTTAPIVGELQIPYATECDVELSKICVDPAEWVDQIQILLEYCEDGKLYPNARTYVQYLTLANSSFYVGAEKSTIRVIDKSTETISVKIKANRLKYSIQKVSFSPSETSVASLLPEAEEYTRLESVESLVNPSDLVISAEIANHDDSINENITVIDTIIPPVLMPPEEIIPTSAGGWDCPICTMFNLEEAIACVACENPRTGSGEGLGATGSLGWWCPSCTFMNPLAASTCSMCGTSRPGTSAMDQAENEDAEQDAPEEDEGSESESVSAEEEELQLEPTEEPKEVTSSTPAETKTLQPVKNGILIKLVGSMNDLGKFKTRVEGSLVLRKQLRSDNSTILPVDMMLLSNKWNLEADTALLEYINGETMGSSNKSFFSKIDSLALPQQYISYRASSLYQYNLMQVQCRIMAIKSLNDSLEEILPLINLSSNDPLSIGSLIRKYSRYLLLNLKQPMLDQVIKSTTLKSGSAAVLSLDNEKALESREAKQYDITTSQCTFVQAFNQLSGKDLSVYRYVFSGDRVFQITFKGEDGIDAGGVYREGMSRMIEDLFSPYFTLLLLCPNGQHTVHVNMDKYVPNPCQKSITAMKMFQFIGRLMAVSIRVKLYLPFEFPSIVWKKIVGEDVGIDDLMAIDSVTCTFLRTLRDCNQDDITDEASFAKKYKQLKFVYTGSDGVERELIKGKDHRIVTYSNRHEYCDAVLHARLHEFDEQINWIASGMNDVIPIRNLQLFSWQQLETLVCGSPTFDIALWKSKTDSSGISQKTLNLFWKVIESLTPKEQAGFVRFAWGRSRLPAEKDFTTKMRLTNAGSNPLPVSHTCFFSIELPEYATEAAMRHGIMTAIHFGVGGILMG